MNKVLKIGGWVVFIAITFVLLGFADVNYDNIKSEEVLVEIEKPGGHEFVTEENVKLLLNDLGYSFKGQSLGEIELNRIESELLEVSGVRKVEAYKFNNGQVKIEIEQQLPIARIVLADGQMGCYLDIEGEVIPLSNNYVAKVPVFTGAIHEPYTDIPSAKELLANDSIAQYHIIDEIYLVAKEIVEDEFLMAQIVQVYVNSKQEFELIPRVGNHRILLGGVEDLSSKMDRLKAFYTSDGLNIKEYNLYDTLNLKYKDQLVCSKR